MHKSMCVALPAVTCIHGTCTFQASHSEGEEVSVSLAQPLNPITTFASCCVCVWVEGYQYTVTGGFISGIIGASLSEPCTSRSAIYI